MENNNLSIRGKSLTGKVVSAKMHRSAVIEWERRVLIPKFERYTKKTSKISVHNPDEINAQEGDFVRVKETRPISKTKNFVITEIIKRAENQ